MESQAKKTELVPFAKKVNNVKALLEKSKAQLALALPRHISIDRMLRVSLNSIQKNPKLLDCTQHSLPLAIMSSAQLGLECDGALGESFLVPYGKTVQLIPGYKGLMKLARNSREISTFDAHPVYAKDHFEFAYGSNSRLEHCPTFDEDQGELIAFYAVAQLKDGKPQFIVMPKRDVDKVMKRSAGYQNAIKYEKDNPWLTDYNAMGMKTCIRRLCKFLPASAELQRAVVLDEQAEMGLEQDFSGIDISGVDITDAEPKSKLDDLVDKKSQLLAVAEDEVDSADARKAMKEPGRNIPLAKVKKALDAETLFPGNPNYGESEREPGIEG